MKSLALVLSFFAALTLATPLADAQGMNVPQDVKTLETTTFTSEQINNLLYARHEADSECPALPTADECHTLTKVAMGILWQESHAGKLGPVGDIKNGFGRRSYGIMQIKLKTALAMLKLDPTLVSTYFPAGSYTEEEVIAELLTNQQFNIQVGVHLLVNLRFTQKLSWASTVRSYNQGEAHRNNEKAKEYLAEYRKGWESPEFQALLN